MKTKKEGNNEIRTYTYEKGAIAFVLWLLTLFLANFWLILLIVLVLGIGLLIYAKKKSPTQTPPKAV